MYQNQENEHSSKSHEQVLIDKIFKKLVNENASHKELARILNNAIETVVNKDEAFIYELLQNADDAVNKYSNAVEVEFKKIHYDNKDYLLFSHNGEHFNDEDIKKICKYSASEKGEKPLNAEKIGYKGVGFKTVFKVATCAHIISKNYQFCFNQKHELWNDNNKYLKYPWPIIPIWHEIDKLPSELRSHIDLSKVNILFTLKNKNLINKFFYFIKNNLSSLIFLNHIQKLTLINETESTIIERKIEKMGEDLEIYNIIVNLILNKTWLVKNFITEIPETITKTLKELSAIACPERLKNAKVTNIKFAVEIEKKEEEIQFNISNDNFIYCYLPTQQNYGFPYLVNANFLLSSSRSELIDNDWNLFLFFKIGYLQIEWLRILASDKKTSKNIFKLLTTELNINKEFSTEFEKGFREGIKNIAFIPTGLSGDILMKAEDCFYDITGFYYSKKFKIYLENKDKKIIWDKLEGKSFVQKKLDNFIDIIKIKTLVSEIEQLVKDNPDIELQINLINFFIKQKNKRKWSEWEKAFSKANIFLTSQGSIVSASSLSILVDELSLDDLKPFTNIYLLNANIPLNPKSENILLDLRAEKLNIECLINKHIKNYLQDNKNDIDHETAMEFYKILLKAYQNKHIKKVNLPILKELPLITQNNTLKAACQTYISNVYKPSTPLEDILNEKDLFISDAYSEKLTSGSHEIFTISQLKRFFLWLGASEKIITFKKNIYIYETEENKEFKAYLNYLREHKKGGPEKVQDAHINDYYIKNFCHINFISLLKKNDAFYFSFWKEISNQFNQIQVFINDSYYVTKTKHYPLEFSFLHYLLSEMKIIKSYNKKRFSVTEILPPTYEHYKNILDVANIGIELTEEQYKFFGFRTTLSVEECLIVLQHLNLEDLVYKKYEVIYQNLIKIFPGITEDEKKLIATSDIKLPSSTNTLQELKMLYVLEPSIKLTMVTSENILKITESFSEENTKILAKLFNIPLILSDDIYPVVDKKIEDKTCCDSIQKALPILAMIEEKAREKETAKIIYTRFLNQYSKLRFYKLPRLSVYAGDPKKPIFSKNCKAYLKDNSIYFAKQWNLQLTLIEFTECLAYYFNLSQTAKAELFKIIHSNKNEIFEYLRENNYDVSLYEELSTFPSSVIDHAPAINSALNNNALQQNEVEDQLTHVELELPASPSNENFNNNDSESEEYSPTNSSVHKRPINESEFDSVFSSPISKKVKHFNTEDSLNFSVSTPPNFPFNSSSSITPSSSQKKKKSRPSISSPTFFAPQFIRLPDADLEKINITKSIEVMMSETLNTTFDQEQEISSHVISASEDESEESTSKNTPKKKRKTGKTSTTQEEKNYIGDQGELYVFDLWRYRYKKRYKLIESIEDTIYGFQINGLDHKGKPVELAFHWHNKKRILGSQPHEIDNTLGINYESITDRDMTIIKNGQEKYIDVKSTSGKSNKKISITNNEWELAKKAGDFYKFFRFNNNPNSLNLVIIKNAPKMLQEKKISIKNYDFMLDFLDATSKKTPSPISKT